MSTPPAPATAGGWRQRLFALVYAKINPRYEPIVGDHKRALFADLRGEVLEIGPGFGANLRYAGAATRWVGIEPNPFMHAALRREAARLGRSIELRGGVAEALEADDASFDAVISTLVLCSVRDVAQTLREARRVLRPGGRLYFVEHVAAPPGTWLRRAQRAFRPVSRYCGDNCHPDRETGASIAAAGFAHVDLRSLRLPLALASPHIIGTATR